MPDPVSWLLIARGWQVTGRRGRDLGRVEEVVADTQKNIFDGVAVAKGLFGPARYVPAERVTSILEGHVETDLTRDEFESLRAYEPRRV
jgi:uncharacterized protein YrrD